MVELLGGRPPSGVRPSYVAIQSIDRRERATAAKREGEGGAKVTSPRRRDRVSQRRGRRREGGEVGMLWGLALLGGFYPLYRAWAAARGSTIRHALAWAFAAWAAWCLAAWPGGAWLHWLALSLTACAGVCVLNA